jgi:ATP-dependent Lhr-like helicase
MATKTRKGILTRMEPEVARWFGSRFPGMTEPQVRAIPLIHEGKNVLISSPTGSGKTLTAFLAIINELLSLEKRGKLEEQVYCVYVSPLKALANDIRKNLIEPLGEISTIAGRELGIRVAVRSGDTSNQERQRMLRRPPHILITTPESLGIVLSAPKFRELLRGTRWAIVDEIHEICSSKRGVQLALNLERLRELAGRNFVRIGLSATQAPIEEIGHFLGGYEGRRPRRMNIVEAKMGKGLDIRVMAPTDRMSELPVDVVNAALYDRLEEMIRSHTTTIVFTNTRSGTERVALKLREMGIESMAAHHGSLSKETRLEVEGQLRGGELQAVVTSTSLELGIDIGSVDLVAQIGSPKSISKGLQRVGRSGHGVGRTSKGRLIAFDNDDLVECAVLVKKARLGHIDRVAIPRNCLDVLAQALVGMSLERVWKADEAYALVRNAHPYRELPRADFDVVLRYLGGLELEDVYSKLWLDPGTGEFGRKKGGRMIYYLNSGTIPDEADYQVFSDKGRHLGKLSEKFVERLGPRDVFVLGGRTYEFLRARGTKAFVRDATGRRPTVPSWTGEMLPRSFDLSMAVGAFRAELELVLGEKGKDGTAAWLQKDYNLDADAAWDIVAYASEQLAVSSSLPSERRPCVESYADDKGQFHAVFHFCYGRRVNDALSRAYAAALSKKLKANVKVSVTDDAFMVTAGQPFDAKVLPDLVTTSNFEGLLRGAIMGTELYKQRFRHCASRSFLVLRNYMGREIPVSRQQMRSQRIMEALVQRLDFPVVKETLAEIFNEVLDVPHALKLLSWIESGELKVRHFSSEGAPSPFAYNVLVAGMADIVLMEDKAALLREMHSRVLKRILGEGMEPLFQPEVVDRYFRAKLPTIASKEGVVALLKAAGPLRLFTTRGRNAYRWSGVPPEQLNAWCEELIAEGCIVSAKAREVVWALPEDLPKLAALFADASPPKGKEKALLSLLADGATHTGAGLAEALKLDRAELKTVASALERRYLVTRGSRDGKYWRAVRVEKVDKRVAMRDLALRILGSSGPMTSEELALELGMGASEATNLLGLLDEEGLVFSGGITYLETQYMLRADAERLKGAKAEGEVEPEKLERLLLAKQFERLPSLKEYFARYPDAGHPHDLFVRVDNFSTAELERMWESGEVLSGRFVGGRVRYVAKDDALALHAFYDRPPLTAAAQRMLEAIEREPGIGLEELSRRTGTGKEAAREAVGLLDWGLYVVRSHQSSSGRNCYVRFEPRGPAPASPMRLVVERFVGSFGPTTAKRLERFLRADRIALEGTLSSLEADGKATSLRVVGEPEPVYLSPADAESLGTHPEDRRLRMLTILDPFTLHFMEEVQARYGDGWYYPLFRGARLCGVVELWEMSGRVDVRNVELDSRGDLSELLARLDELQQLYTQQHMDTTCVSGAFGRAVDDLTGAELALFTEAGYVRVHSWLAKGIDTDRVLTFDEFTSLMLLRQHLAPGTQFSTIEELDRALVGIRSEEEVLQRLSRPPRGLSLRELPGMHLAFGVPNVMTWFTLESGTRYRAALQEPETPLERAALEALRCSGGMGKRALLDGVLGGPDGRGVLDSMVRRCMIARNSFGRLVQVPLAKGGRREGRRWLVERIASNYGVVSPESISIYTNGEIGAPEARSYLHELRKEGKLVKGFLMPERESPPWLPHTIPYWMPAEDADRTAPKISGELLVGPGWKDRLAHYMRPWAQHLHKLGSAYLIFKDGRLLGGFTGKRSGGTIHVKKFSGDEQAWQVARRQATLRGTRLARGESETPRADDEEIDEWAKKLMLSTRRR